MSSCRTLSGIMCSTQRSPPSFPVCADNRYFFGALCKLLRVAAVPPVVAFFCGIRGLGSRAVFFFFSFFLFSFQTRLGRRRFRYYIDRKIVDIIASAVVAAEWICWVDANDAC